MTFGFFAWGGRICGFRRGYINTIARIWGLGFLDFGACTLIWDLFFCAGRPRRPNLKISIYFFIVEDSKREGQYFCPKYIQRACCGLRVYIRHLLKPKLELLLGRGQEFDSYISVPLAWGLKSISISCIRP